MISYAELRARARESLRGNWLYAILTVVLMILISGALQYIPILGPIASLILSGPLSLGLASFFLNAVRGEKPSVANLFDGFQDFTRSLVLYLLILVFTLLWTLLLVIPGIIAAFRYSMAYYILKDNPDISASEALRRSKEMMVGHKGRLFVLYLTFIGWWILSCITCGIGFLWLMPYIYATTASFYNDLKDRSLGATHTPPVFTA